MTPDEIKTFINSMGYDESEFRATFHVTRMVTTTDIETAKNEIIFCYAFPYLESVDYETFLSEVSLDAQSDIARNIFKLVYARMLYTQLYKTEYATVKPTKKNAELPTYVEINRQIGAFRRMGITALRQVWRKYNGGLQNEPLTIKILGDEL